MRLVLGISTVLGVIGVIAAFGLFFLGDRVFHIDRAHIQTLMYLKLSVAGHLTIFLTRTRGPFWSIKPARILWMAVLGTQIVATLIAVYGIFMTPLGWGWAGFVWGYAIIWALMTDRIKLLAYKIFDRTKPHDDSKPDTMNKTNAETALAPKIEDKAAPKPIDQPEASAQPATKPDDKPAPKPEGQPEAAPVPKTDDKPLPKPDDKATPIPQAKPEVIPKAKTTPAPEITDEENTLLKMTLGDVLLSGLLKDPKDAGRLITKAISDSEASGQDNKDEEKAEQKPGDNGEPKPEDKV